MRTVNYLYQKQRFGGGYVFVSVGLWVCQSVSRIIQGYERILVKFSRGVGGGAANNQSDFGSHP